MSLKNKTKFLTLIAVAMIAANVTVANAAEARRTSGIYSGVNYNYMDIQYKNDFYSSNYNAVNPYVGYDINENIAVEGGLFATDESNKSFREDTSFGSFDGKYSAKFSGFNLDLVGKLPVSEDFRFIGSAGYMRTKFEASLYATDGTDSVYLSGTETANGYRFGLGAEYDIYKGLYVRAMGYYADLGFKDIETAKIASIGVGYKF